MTQTHTPGPWHFSGSMNGRTVRIVAARDSITAINGGDGCIATVELPHAGVFEPDTPSAAGANARLIAAAPDMLAALRRNIGVIQMAVAVLEIAEKPVSADTLREAVREMSAAIAKATS